jgi:predicted lipid-binding transport protein (Tim44 family)
MPSATLPVQDPVWDPHAIKACVREVFFRVQQARIECNWELARDCLSAALYQKHKPHTGAMPTAHAPNVLEQIAQVEARVVSVAAYRDDTQDHFWVFIEGSLIDDAMDDRTGRPIRGTRADAAGLTELWKFVRGASGWVLDEIEPDAGATDLVQLHNFSEVLAAAAQARMLRAAELAHAGAH